MIYIEKFIWIGQFHAITEPEKIVVDGTYNCLEITIGGSLPKDDILLGAIATITSISIAVCTSISCYLAYKYRGLKKKKRLAVVPANRNSYISTDQIRVSYFKIYTW